MSQLQQLQANVDSQVAEMLSNGAKHNDVLVTFEMKLERAQALLRQVTNATNLDHALRANLLTVEQSVVLQQAISYIINHTNHLVEDLNSINSSGIHEVIEPTRYGMIVNSILDVADSRYTGESLWRTVKSKFTKAKHFTELFISAPAVKVLTVKEESLHDFPELFDPTKQPELTAN